MYTSIDFTVKGVAPLLMHNGQLADPLNQWTKKMKEVTSKRSKTDSDHEEMARIEWHGGLYVDQSGRVCIPGINIEAMLLAAGKKQKLGNQFKAGVLCDGNWPVEYDGPKDPAALWETGKFRDTRGVKINGKSTVQRTRPIFRAWSLKFTVSYLPDLLNEKQVLSAVVTAGRLVGLCDFKPKFGRFEVI